MAKTQRKRTLVQHDSGPALAADASRLGVGASSGKVRAELAVGQAVVAAAHAGLCASTAQRSTMARADQLQPGNHTAHAPRLRKRKR